MVVATCVTMVYGSTATHNAVTVSATATTAQTKTPVKQVPVYMCSCVSDAIAL